MSSQTGLLVVTLVVTNINAVAALFCLVASISTIVILCYHHAYKKELYTLFVFLLFSTATYSLVLVFESAAVNIVMVSDKYETWYNSTLANVLCTVSGIFVHYTTLLDFLVITTINGWVARVCVKSKTLEEAIEKSTKKTKIRNFVSMTFCLIIPLPYVLGLIELNKALWCYVKQPESNDTDTDWIYLKHLAYLEVPIYVLSFLNIALIMYKACMMTFEMNIIEIMKIQSKDICKEGVVLFALILMALVGMITYGVELMVVMETVASIIVTRVVLPGFKAVKISIRSVLIVFLFNYLIKNKPKMQKEPSDTNILS